MHRLCRPRNRALLLYALLWLCAIAVGLRFIGLVLLDLPVRLRAAESQPPMYWWLGFRSGDLRTGFSGPLVRIVHQSWRSRRVPRLFADWSRSFSRCLPDFRQQLWTDEDNRKLIASHYSWFLGRYDSLAPGVQRADVSRLFYMYHYGGLYCDMDCECLRDFRHLLINASLAFGAMQGHMFLSPSHPAYVSEGQIENSFMYSRPRHPFFWDLILQMNATTGEMPIMSSGPYLIMKGIHAARKLGIASGIRVDSRDFLTVYAPQYFNPFSWIRPSNRHCSPFGRFPDRGKLKLCRDSFAGSSYVVQYHTQVWDKGRYLLDDKASSDLQVEQPAI